MKRNEALVTFAMLGFILAGTHALACNPNQECRACLLLRKTGQMDKLDKQGRGWHRPAKPIAHGADQ